MRGSWTVVVCGMIVGSLLACSSTKPSDGASMEAKAAKLDEAEAAPAEAAPAAEPTPAAEPAAPKEDEPEYTKGGELIVREPSKGGEAKGQAPSAAPGAGKLSGKIIKKPWSKSGESWRAGGSEYYVLDVGGAEVEDRTAEEGVILRASDSVSMEEIAAAVDSEVEVNGVYVPDTPYEPQDPGEQYPMGMDGKPVPRGGGFRVLTLTPR